jgi:hypothetical protein
MICLTFDTDWMNSESMRRFIEDFPFPGKGTFFLWQEMSQVNWGIHEIEPHPIFSEGHTWEEDIDKIEKQLYILPKGMRTHSCVYSHMLGIELKRRGYLYSSVTTPLFQDNLFPYRQPWGIWELPIYYMDNMDYCLAENWPALNHRPFNPKIIDLAIQGEALYVFDFHPLHIVLNTPNLKAYQSVRKDIVNNTKSPFDLVFPGEGARTFFLELCKAMARCNKESLTCLEVLDGLSS